MKFKASKFAPEDDVINSMPDNVVTHILDRLPLQHAVRTSILSKNWRFKWTMLSHLVFDKDFFEYLLKTGCERNYGKIISRLLLHVKGVVTKFVLSVDERGYSVLDVDDIEHWILFLSRNGIKDLTFWKRTGPPLVLPTHLFSCLELKHLKLIYCVFNPPAIFHGFPKLLSLELDLVVFEGGVLGKFISRCPLLETLNMCLQRPLREILNTNAAVKGKVKIVEIAKLTNLKILSFSLCCLEDTKVTNFGSIFELVGSLPKLQQLELDFAKCKFTGGGAKKRSATAFPCLKALKLSRIDLGDGIMPSRAFELIRSFPNLQSLEILASEWDADLTRVVCSPEVDHITVGLLHLRSVIFTYVKHIENGLCVENEACLIRYLLACSPSLEKIDIHPYPDMRLSKESRFLKKLLKPRPASPMVEIFLY